MVHGSSHTGACLESTPDGREGWYPYFVRNGVASYVVDQAGRGRSGFDESVIHEGEARLAAGDAAAAADLIPGFGRITDDGAWTNWFGHLVPANSTILTGKLIPHGDAADPNPESRQVRPRGAAVSDRRRGPEPGLASRRHRTCARRHRTRTLRARVLQAAGSERGSHAAGLHLQDVRSDGARAGQHLDAAESGGAGRAARRRDRRHPLAIGDHGPPHDPHSEGARPSRAAEGVDHDRRIVLASEQRPDRGGLRQHSLHGAQRRLRERQHAAARTPSTRSTPGARPSRDRRRRTI